MKKHILIALMMVMTVTVTAQTQVERAYESLKQSGFARTQRTNHNYDDNGQRTGLLEIYSFATTSASDRRVVENLINAFSSNSDDAYSYVSHQAGDDTQRYAVYYDPQNSEVIGRDKKDNYVLFNVMDPDDATNTYRYCYALEWRADDDGNLTGRALKTYAPKPRSLNKLYAKRDGGPLTINIGGDTTIMVDLDSLIDLSGLGKIKELKDLKELKGLEKLKELDGLDILGSLGKLGSLDGLEELKDRIIVLSGDEKDEPADDVEWLTSFNHYRNAFKRAAAKESSTTASYATSILKLCKNVKKAGLTEGELNLCRKSIKEMQKLTKDLFVKGLLDEAITYLR